jgi:hypothetical protein
MCRHPGTAIPQLGANRPLDAVALDCQSHLVADVVPCDGVGELVVARHRLAVDGDDEVILLKAGRLSSAVVLNRVDLPCRSPVGWVGDASAREPHDAEQDHQ